MDKKKYVCVLMSPEEWIQAKQAMIESGHNWNSLIRALVSGWVDDRLQLKKKTKKN